jgi:hypothetical protein
LQEVEQRELHIHFAAICHHCMGVVNAMHSLRSCCESAAAAYLLTEAAPPLVCLRCSACAGCVPREFDLP